MGCLAFFFIQFFYSFFSILVFNIKDTVFIKAEALDIYPEKVDEILDDVIKNIKSMI